MRTPLRTVANPPDDPSEELRDAETMLRRAGRLVAVALLVVMLILAF